MRLLSISLVLATGCFTSELPGSSWRLVEVNGYTSSDEAPVILALRPDGFFIAETGCHRGSGAYELGGESITFVSIATTRDAHRPEPELAMQEDRVFEMLLGADRWKIVSDRLVLRGPDALAIGEPAAVPW